MPAPVFTPPHVLATLFDRTVGAAVNEVISSPDPRRLADIAYRQASYQRALLAHINHRVQQSGVFSPALRQEVRSIMRVLHESDAIINVAMPMLGFQVVEYYGLLPQSEAIFGWWTEAGAGSPRLFYECFSLDRQREENLLGLRFEDSCAADRFMREAGRRGIAVRGSYYRDPLDPWAER